MFLVLIIRSSSVRTRPAPPLVLNGFCHTARTVEYHACAYLAHLPCSFIGHDLLMGPLHTVRGPAQCLCMDKAYYTLTDLATRWACVPRTARQRTCEPGFPPVLALSRKQLLWSVEEVHGWEQTRMTRQPRPVRARYRGQALPLPAKVVAA